jgi:hypothetical protein
MVECAFLGFFTNFYPEFELQQVLLFCWIGFCARDNFKRMEVKWCQLPWLVLLESMTSCRLALQCTTVEH